MKKLLALSILLLAGALSAVGLPPLFLLSPMSQSVLLFNAVDVAAITAYADEHKRDLIATLVNGLDIAKDITVIPNVKNKIQLTKLTVGNGFRPYSSVTEFKKSITYTDRELSTKTGKRELLIDVRDFKNKHLAWRTSPGNRASKSFKDMDFAAFTWDQVIKNLQREINDETAYFGFDNTGIATYSEVATYTANTIVKFAVDGVVEYFQNISGGTTTAGEDPLDTPAKWRYVTARSVVPGLKSYIDAAISGGFAVTTTGAISSSSTAIAAFKKLFRAMPIPYQQHGVIIHASYTDSDFLVDGLEDVSKYTTAEVSDLISGGLIPIPGTDYKGWVKRATWLGTSRRLIAEPMAGAGMGTNLVMGTDLLSDMNDIKQVPALWNEQFGISVDLGFQIQDLEALRLGDQA